MIRSEGCRKGKQMIGKTLLGSVSFQYLAQKSEPQSSTTPASRMAPSLEGVLSFQYGDQIARHCRNPSRFKVLDRETSGEERSS